MARSPNRAALASGDAAVAFVGHTAARLPRTQESRPTRRDGCLAREMRKPNRATRTAAGVPLLFWDLRLLVRHAGTSRGRLLLPRRAIVRPAGTTGEAAGARHALPRGALQLKTRARVHHRRAASVNGRDDLL